MKSSMTRPHQLGIWECSQIFADFQAVRLSSILCKKPLHHHSCVWTSLAGHRTHAVLCRPTTRLVPTYLCYKNKCCHLANHFVSCRQCLGHVEVAESFQSGFCSIGTVCIVGPELTQQLTCGQPQHSMLENTANKNVAIEDLTGVTAAPGTYIWLCKQTSRDRWTQHVTG